MSRLGFLYLLAVVFALIALFYRSVSVNLTCCVTPQALAMQRTTVTTRSRTKAPLWLRFETSDGHIVDTAPVLFHDSKFVQGMFESLSRDEIFAPLVNGFPLSRYGKGDPENVRLINEQPIRLEKFNFNVFQMLLEALVDIRTHPNAAAWTNIRVDPDSLPKMIEMASFFAMESLMSATAQAFSVSIAGMGTVQLREHLRIKSDYTFDQEAAMKLEGLWTESAPSTVQAMEKSEKKEVQQQALAPSPFTFSWPTMNFRLNPFM